MYSLPVLGKFILIDGASCWLYCVPTLWLQTRLNIQNAKNNSGEGERSKLGEGQKARVVL